MTRTKRSIETWRATAAQTILPEGLSGLLLDVFIPSETCEVQTGEVGSRLAVCHEFGFGSSWARNYGQRIEVCLLRC